MNRRQLVEHIAIGRALYEAETLSRGYTEESFQDLEPFVKSEALATAKSRPVAGIKVTETGAFYTRINFSNLTAEVARQLPGWRETVARNAS